MGVVGGEPVSEERRKEHRPGLPPRAGPAAAGSCTLLLLPSQCLLLPDDNKVTEIKSKNACDHHRRTALVCISLLSGRHPVNSRLLAP
jgi:hypothetical protein